MAFQQGAFQSGAFQMESASQRSTDPLPIIIYEKVRLKAKDRRLRDTIKNAYEALYNSPIEVKQQAANIVVEFSEAPKAVWIPPPNTVDYTKMLKSIDAVDRLMLAYEKLQIRNRQKRDEEWLIMMSAV